MTKRPWRLEKRVRALGIGEPTGWRTIATFSTREKAQARIDWLVSTFGMDAGEFQIEKHVEFEAAS